MDAKHVTTTEILNVTQKDLACEVIFTESERGGGLDEVRCEGRGNLSYRYQEREGERERRKRWRDRD